MEEKRKKKVCLQIDGTNHHLSKSKKYSGDQVCPKCSLYETHSAYCWSIGKPICSVLAEANNWDEDFAVYFKTINRKQRR